MPLLLLIRWESSRSCIHRYSSVLSAYGMALADVVDERQEPDSSSVEGGRATWWSELKSKMEKLKEKSPARRSATKALTTKRSSSRNI